VLQVPIFSRSTAKWSERSAFLAYGIAAIKRAASRKLETPLSLKPEVIGPFSGGQCFLVKECNPKF
jgi:hypothetical protein